MNVTRPTSDGVGERMAGRDGVVRLLSRGIRSSGLIVALFALTVMALTVTPLQSASTPFTVGGMVAPPLVVQDTEVTQVVTTLMQRYNMPVRVVGKVQGRISGRFAEVEVTELLDHLSAIYGFYWYFDGSFVEIGPVGDVTIKLLQVPPQNVEAFTADIDSAGMDISQFPLSVNRATGTMIAKGPERLITMLENISKFHQAPPTAPAPSAARASEPPVKIIYGRDLLPSVVGAIQ